VAAHKTAHRLAEGISACNILDASAEKLKSRVFNDLHFGATERHQKH
jgi:hypothetical protein